MAKINGIWIWNAGYIFNNEFWSIVDHVDLNFTSNGKTFNRIWILDDGRIKYDEVMVYANLGEEYYWGENSAFGDTRNYQIIDFGTEQQEVLDDWYNVFIKNATQIGGNSSEEGACFCHFNGYEVKDAKARRDIETLNTEFAEVRQSVESANTEIASIRENLDSTYKDIAYVRDDIETANTEIASVKQSVESANTEIASVKQSVESANTEIASVKQSVDSANSEIDSVRQNVETTLSGFDERIRAIEESFYDGDISVS